MAYDSTSHGLTPCSGEPKEFDGAACDSALHDSAAHNTDGWVLHYSVCASFVASQAAGHARAGASRTEPRNERDAIAQGVTSGSLESV